VKDIIAEIAKVVDNGGLLLGDDVTARPTDWHGLGNCEAKAVIRPKNTQQLSDVMKLCHAAGQTVVAEGGLTGLVHGVDPAQDDIVISFERMTDVEHIDPIGRTMIVQAGAPLQKAQEAAAKEQLLFAVDLGARGSATIGGNIATNAGGNQVLRYGMMRENILGLEVVLADGTIISSMNSLLKNNSGYDLKQLFIGAEGTLGFVTRAVLRLRPETTTQNTALLAIPDFDSLVTFFQTMGAKLGERLTAFEVMWRECYEIIAVESERHTPPLPVGSPYYVIVESRGNDTERDADYFIDLLGETIEGGLVSDAIIASSETQAKAIWAIREDIEALVKVLFPAAIFDVSMPIAKMENYISDLKNDLRVQWGDTARLCVFGHLGDGNLHIVVSPRPWTDDVQSIAEAIVYKPLQAIGGSISAEHGIGLEKRDWLHISRSPEEIALMKTLKHALDPKGLLNPGKIWATGMGS